MGRESLVIEVDDPIAYFTGKGKQLEKNPQRFSQNIYPFEHTYDLTSNESY